MAVRAKFQVTQKTQFHYDKEATEVKLAPVMATEGEDSIFGKATPNGEMRLYIKNPAAAEQFQIGGKYYVDFTPAE